MDNEFFVNTGSIIKEYLEEIGIEQKDCAKRMGISNEYFSNIISGNSVLTEEIAHKLENIIRGVPASYWINYEVKYREHLNKEELSSKNYSKEQLRVLAKRFKFNAVFRGLKWSLTKQANEMLKILRIDSFEQFDKNYASLNVDFMEDGGEKEAIAIWLNLATEEIEIQNKDLSNKRFNKKELLDSLDKIKKLSLNKDYEVSLKSARKFLNRFGVYLVLYDAIENSKVRGALTTYNGNPAIFLTGRFKTHDHVWFALMHEIGHLIKHYKPNEPIVTLESELEINKNIDTKEKEANEFSRDFFINKHDYKEFIKSKKFDEKTIISFSNEQGIRPGIVVARLQHDGYIGFEKLSHLKDRLIK